jgi:hypothetical protein
MEWKWQTTIGTFYRNQKGKYFLFLVPDKHIAQQHTANGRHSPWQTLSLKGVQMPKTNATIF